jgi:hypothetical protein
VQVSFDEGDILGEYRSTPAFVTGLRLARCHVDADIADL